ncbi:MAG: transglycosylase SLT domain-containing protein [Fibrobacterales bacterium]
MVRMGIVVFLLMAYAFATTGIPVGESFVASPDSTTDNVIESVTAPQNSSVSSAEKNMVVQPVVVDTLLLSADAFKKSYWHAQVDTQSLNELAKIDPLAEMFITGMRKFRIQQYREALTHFERSIVYSEAYRELAILYLYRSYFALREYRMAFTVLKNYYHQFSSTELKNKVVDELSKTATFLASTISSEHFWSNDTLAEYEDFLIQKDSLITIIQGLDPKRAYNKYLLLKEEVHIAFAQGFEATGDSLCYVILKGTDNQSLLKWAYSAMTDGYKSKSDNFYLQSTLAETEFKLRNYTVAIAHLKTLLKRKPKWATKVSFNRKLAFSYRKTSQYSKAITLYKWLVKKARKQATANDYLNLARSYRSLDQKKSANYWYTQFSKRFPKHTKALEIKWTKGFELEQDNKLAQAIKAYNQFPPSKYDTKRGKWIGFRKGYVEFKRGRLKSAIKQFKKVIKNHDLLWPAAASRFYLGKAYLKLNKRREAQNWFLKTIKDYPVGFYAHRARHYLINDSLMIEDSIPSISLLEYTEEETIAWLQNQQNKKTVIDPTQLLQVETLLALGCWDEAELRYKRIYKSKVGRLDFMYQFSKLFLRYGNIAQSYRISRQMAWRLDRRELMSSPRPLMELLYLRPYFDKVTYHAKKMEVEPYFVLALMRQESIFDSDIESFAGAHGLMQIMPATGKELARRENIVDFDPERLFNPYLAIRLGIRYIGDLMKRWDNEYLVLSNYNAGPRPTKRWKKNNGHLDTEMFVEEISYWETRDYLKKVMGNYWTYQMIWGNR